MDTVLVAYATKHGSTREVAADVGRVLRQAGFEVEINPAREVKKLDSYQAVVLGGALYMGRLHKDARKLLASRCGELTSLPLAVFAMGPKSTEPQELAERRRPARACARRRTGGQAADDGYLRRRDEVWEEECPRRSRLGRDPGLGRGSRREAARGARKLTPSGHRTRLRTGIRFRPPTADNVRMRHLQLHRHGTASEIVIPEATSVYETAIQKLMLAHENEAAAYLAQCHLEISATRGVHPLGEQLHPVRLVLTGPGDAVAELEQNAEIRGRVRQALDGALGPTIYLAQMAVSARPSALAGVAGVTTAGHRAARRSDPRFRESPGAPEDLQAEVAGEVRSDCLRRLGRGLPTRIGRRSSARSVAFDPR